MIINPVEDRRLIRVLNVMLFLLFLIFSNIVAGYVRPCAYPVFINKCIFCVVVYYIRRIGIHWTLKRRIPNGQICKLNDVEIIILFGFVHFTLFLSYCVQKGATSVPNPRKKYTTHTHIHNFDFVNKLIKWLYEYVVLCIYI